VNAAEPIHNFLAAQPVQLQLKALDGGLVKKIHGRNQVVAHRMNAPGQPLQSHDGPALQGNDGLVMGFDPFPIDDLSKVEKTWLGAASQCPFIHEEASFQQSHSHYESGDSIKGLVGILFKKIAG
jgi:hypothetical protein